MFLGLLVVGMTIGAAAAGAWVYSGGSLLLAVVIYSLVATSVVLGLAILSFLVSDRKPDETCGSVEPLQPAE